MLSIQTIRERTDEVRRAAEQKGDAAPVDRILELDGRRRDLLSELEGMRAGRNRAGKAIGAAKDDAERQRLIEEQRAVAGRLDELEASVREVDGELRPLMLEVPNLFHEDVVPGGEEDSVVVIEGDGATGEERRLETPVRIADYPTPAIDESARPHWELGEELGAIDFERGVKIAGAHFYILIGDAARIQRALIAWMLDVHREQGYREVYTPFLVKEEMLVGTGQLPKFADTLFHDYREDVWLVPTAEVPVTNMYRDEILEAADLPIDHSAYTPCFRHEQFSAGRATRGIMRGWQFDKVEMVKFVREGESWEALERLLDDALEIVRRLGLRYRVQRLAAGDLSFASAMTYDIDVWAPGAQEWLEVSSCSNFLDFQARRANLRYRDEDGTVRHMHTLNGSGLALPRLLATIMECGQLEDGSIELPSVLRPYLGGLETLETQR